jgi:hypothetical protein
MEPPCRSPSCAPVYLYHPVQIHIPHQPFHGAARDRDSLPAKLPLDLASAVNLEVLGKLASDLDLESHIPPRSRRELSGIGALGGVGVIG